MKQWWFFKHKLNYSNLALFQLLHEVVPIMISYALIGAISAVVELASVALASAYVAQISRRRLREKQQSWVSRNALESQVLDWSYYPVRISQWRTKLSDSFIWSQLIILNVQSLLFLKMGQPRPFLFIFGLFKQTIQFLQQINVKNVMSIQYPALGFEPMTFGTWVSSHNHENRAPTLQSLLLALSFGAYLDCIHQ